jgi:lipoic acid synthetase
MKPEWLRIRIRADERQHEVEEILNRLSLHTVCEEACCPNRMECFGKRTATFMILGRTCTRNCTFCNVEKGSPQEVDPDEPAHVAQAVLELQLKHTVITSVTRDDLPDGGATHFARVVEEIRKLDKKNIIEVLIPDFQGNRDSLLTVIKSKPDIINHNLETVPRLYSTVRPMAVYERSLQLISRISELDNGIYTKSGIMVGLGESGEEVEGVFRDLRSASCDILTVGQYLAPSRLHHPVVEYVHPDIFAEYGKRALKMGFRYVASAPLVRSSYQAEKVFEK